MNLHSPHHLGRASSHDAVFASLRVKLAAEVESNAVLVELLQKLNGMQEAQTRPVEFREWFSAFVARADEHLDIVRPFLPDLMKFLLKESRAAVGPRVIEADGECGWTRQVA